MYATAIIVFREIIEASLIISIVMAATRGVFNRGIWVSAGITVGLLGAGVVALFAGVIAKAVSGMGQELFNAGILLIAVVMLGWHNIWMKRHGRELGSKIGTLGRNILSGNLPLYALSTAVGIAVIREGAEVVLFLYGIAASPDANSRAMFIGATSGIVCGLALGFTLYLGLLRIPMRYLFSVTSWMILLLAAGMAAQAANYLEQAGVLPQLGSAVWNTSHILSEHSVLGQLLHTLIGYMARPDGIQIVFYLGTLIVIGYLMKYFDNKVRGHISTPK